MAATGTLGLLMARADRPVLGGAEAGGAALVLAIILATWLRDRSMLAGAREADEPGTWQRLCPGATVKHDIRMYVTGTGD